MYKKTEMEWWDFKRNTESKEQNGSWTERHIIWILCNGWITLPKIKHYQRND